MKRRTFSFMLSLGLISPAAHSQTEPHVLRHADVYRETGRFGGWPANHGMWSWGDDFLVGFSRGYHKDLGDQRHNIDRERPEEHLFARSTDGGETWRIENPSATIVPMGGSLHGITPPGLTPIEAIERTEPLPFARSGFAMTFRRIDNHRGPTRFHVSTDQGRTWSVPYRFPRLGTNGIAARTSYIIDDARTCTTFMTAAKSDGREGRTLCARTTDGGVSWRFLGWIGPEPDGFRIMPSGVRISPDELLVVTRRREENHRFLDSWRSVDNGVTWQRGPIPNPDLGEGNPPSLIRLMDGRLCLTYGLRKPPYAICAQFSDNDGHSWSRPVFIRQGGAGRDMGYVQSRERYDGRVVSVYYFQDDRGPERFIGATLWDPNRV